MTGAAKLPRVVPADAAVTLKHGAGGRTMRRLIEEILATGYPMQRSPGDRAIGLAAMDDGAAIPIGDAWLVVTTDAHVIHPIVFPGGDIGRLAVCGTVNDLAMMGATEPLGLTCAVIVEDGFHRADLERVHRSMVEACEEAGSTVVTGDTKVMGRGEVDGLLLITTGVALTSTVVSDAGLRTGDRLIVTGTIGDHGIALMVKRHGLSFDEDLRSDVAPLNGLVRAVLASADGAIVAMKDPTRGGVASCLHEMAEKSSTCIMVHEAAVPVHPGVRSAADLLGLDPFQIANEGKAIVGVRGDDQTVERVVSALRAHPLGHAAALIGECIEGPAGRVVLDTGIGRRLMTEAEGDPLPRIC